MLITKTLTEVIEEYKLRHVMKPEVQSAVSAYHSTIDLDGLIALRLNDWYSNTLLTAPTDLLPTEDAHEDIMFQVSPTGRISFEIPQGYCRLASVKLGSWLENAEILTLPGDAARAHLYAGEFAPAGKYRPVAIVNNRNVSLLNADCNGDVIERCLLVKEPDGNNITLDSSLFASLNELELIPQL